MEQLVEGMLSWKSLGGLLIGLLLIFALVFVDWRSLLQRKRFKLEFAVWR